MFFPGAGPDEGGARRGGADTYNPKDSNQKTRSGFQEQKWTGTAEFTEPGPGTSNSRTRSGRPFTWCELASTRTLETARITTDPHHHVGIKKPCRRL